jgi:YVTN family beta-propeller protein
MKRYIVVLVLLSFFLVSHSVSAAPYAYIPSVYGSDVTVFDTGTYTTVGSPIPVGTWPNTIGSCPDGKKVYVGNYGSNSVSVIDTTTRTVIETITGISSPVGVACNPSSTRMYVVGSSEVAVIDTASNIIVDRISIPSSPPYGPFGVALDPKGTKIYITGYTATSNVYVIDAAINTIIDTIPVRSTPTGVEVHPSGRTLWVTEYGDNTVSVVNVATKAITTIPVGINPTYLAFHPEQPRAYVTNRGDGTVSVIDTETLTVSNTIPVGNDSGGIRVVQTGNTKFQVWVVSSFDNRISIIDPATETVFRTLSTGNFPYAFGNFIVPDQSPPPIRAYIANAGTDNVSVIDTSTNTVITTTSVVGYPYGVAVHPLESEVFVVNFGLGTIGYQSVSAINTSSYASTTTQVGVNPRSIAINPSGTRVYVPNGYADSYPSDISVIDTSTGVVVDTIAVPLSPFGAVVHPSGNQLYVSNRDPTATTLWAIDTATKQRTDINVGGRTLGLAISHSGGRLYATNYSTNSVEVIDTALNTVIETIPITPTASPYGIALNPAGTKLYVGGYTLEGGIAVIDTEDLTVTGVMPAPNYIMGLSFYPDGTRAYATNTGNNTVLVIDAMTDTIIDQVSVGTSPVSHGKFIRDKFILRAETGGSGGGSLSASGLTNTGDTWMGPYAHTSVVTVTATPDAGSVFVVWGGCNEVSGNVCTVIMGSDRKVMAVFLVNQPAKLSVGKKKVNKGDGIVMSSDGKINCGATCKSQDYIEGFVTLSAAAYPGSVFAGWEPAAIATLCPTTDPCELQLPKSLKVKARFIGDYALTIKKGSKNRGAGTVTDDLGKVNCGSTCSALYAYNTPVTLTATPAGVETVTWSPASLGCSGTSCTVTMAKKKNVKVTFTAP